MGVPSSPGQAAKRTASHSIDFYFTAGLIVPVSCLLVAWGLITGVVLSGTLDRLRWLGPATPGQRTLTGSAVIAGTGIIVVLAAVLLMGGFARRLSRDAGRLAETARQLAGERLPRLAEALRGGEQAEAEATAPPLPPSSVTEIAAATAAVARLHRASAAAAAAEAGLRTGFREILVSLGRRNQSLLHRQLRIIDALEQQASSPAALAELFALDHLTTRMRRHAESLTILSGAAPGRTWSDPVQIIDVMRAAAAEVEDYTRVSVISDSTEAVAAAAVTDMIHLLAELIENATLFSPSSTRVEVRAERVANGFAIEVEDRGLGIPPDQLRELNAQLADPPDFHLADADRLGLFVAGRLAARHGVDVSLSPSPYRGTKAVVVLPDSIVVAAENKSDHPERTLRDSAQLSLRAPATASLAGAPAPGSASDAGDASADGDASVAVPAEKPASSTVHGLPRRVRSGSQSLDDSGAALRAEDPAPRNAPVDAPAPEAARSLAASLQNSWNRSRQPDDSAASERPAARQDATASDSAPDSEEALWLLCRRAAPRREIWPGC